jgi:hypothetical protein
MRYVIFFILIALFTNCKQKEQNSSQIVTKNQVIALSNDSIRVQQDSITCQLKGDLVESFEQNNTKFERLRIQEDELEWLKVTLSNGSCKIIYDSDIRHNNHHYCIFEDWDKDGFKDRIDKWKWNYEVGLFSKEKNDFSRKINGVFCGEQYDFDKKRGLKWQFLESKFGGTYELYSLKDFKKTTYSEIELSTAYDTLNTGPTITISKKGSNKYNRFDSKSFFIKAKSKDEDYQIMMKRWNESALRYWRKNLSPIIQKY